MIITIREAKLEDVEILFRIRTSVVENYRSREQLAEMGVTPQTVTRMLQTDCQAWIAEQNQKPVAFSLANAVDHTVFALFVLPACEGQGIGGQLMQRAEDWLWQQGAAEIWLLTGNNPQFRAYGFYLHRGWQPVGHASDRQMKFIKTRNDTFSC